MVVKKELREAAAQRAAKDAFIVVVYENHLRYSSKKMGVFEEVLR